MIRELLNKKETGTNWTETEIKTLVEDFTDGKISDTDMTEWLKYVCEHGMNDEEILFLTKAQLNSGEVLDLSEVHGVKVDKHSTGGVGDKTTLIVAPIVAALGIPVVKMSGHALGHTGGTIDKLESIAGFKVTLSKEEILKQANEIGVVLTSQTANLAPADKKIYALRDLTNTVKSIPLITASIMSKKLASGADKLVLDVKFGTGAFCDTLSMAEELAKKMVTIGNMYGKETVAIITDMNQPLGKAIGNAVEVKEAMDVLKGKGPADLRKVCVVLASEMVALAKGVDITEARSYVDAALGTSRAYNKFIELINAQGGDLSGLIIPSIEQQIFADKSGFITGIKTAALGELLMDLGAGRHHKDDKIDYQVGIMMERKLGDYVHVGDKLMTLRVKDDHVNINIDDYFTITSKPTMHPPLIYKVIR